MMLGLVECNDMILKPLKRMRNLVILSFLFLFLSFHPSNISNATSMRISLRECLDCELNSKTLKTAVSMSESLGTDTTFQERRVSRKNIFFDEL